jgi:hypothetical protein
MTRKLCRAASHWIIAGLALASSIAHAEITITLKNSFIERYQNRATIETTYTVDKAHPKPNAPSKDGDMHIAGRAPEIGLASVAEIMNAASTPKAVKLIKSAESSGNPVRITGAWRLWNEHAGSAAHSQLEEPEPATSTNPDHAFEIHPVTSVGNESTAGTLRPIAGFKPKEASDAFTRYENVRSRLIPEGDTTTIITSSVGYNYVNFQMQLSETPRDVEDGKMAFAQVRDYQGELVVRSRRMVFVKDSPPEKLVRNLKPGSCRRVLGIPRIDLALVAWRVANYHEPKWVKMDVLNWNLPYEIIVVGVYPGKCAVD